MHVVQVTTVTPEHAEIDVSGPASNALGKPIQLLLSGDLQIL